jgi:hypothetical protein
MQGDAHAARFVVSWVTTRHMLAMVAKASAPVVSMLAES